MDTNFITGSQSGSGIDAFVRSVITKGRAIQRRKDLNPEWNLVYWICARPARRVGPVGSVATVEVLDKDKPEFKSSTGFTSLMTSTRSSSQHWVGIICTVWGQKREPG